VFKFIDSTRTSINIDALAMIQVKRIMRESSKTKRAANVVHVGAFDGQASLSLVEMLKPLETHVIALEPCIRNFKLLKKAFGSNDNLTAVRCAAGSKAATRNIFISRESTLKSSKGSSQSNSFYSEFVDDKNLNNGYAEVIKVLPLQTIFDDYDLKVVDLLRINCEGGEYNIFEVGASTGFLNQVNVVAIAIHGKSKVFLTDKMIQHKIYINNVLKMAGFQQIYGFKFAIETTKIPTGHVWQIWSKI